MSDRNTFTHREAWLTEAARCLESAFKQRGWPLPEDVRFTCGFPSTRPCNGTKNQRIGECWYAESSKDGTVEVMVSPVVDEPMRVIGILAHELVHAAVGPGHGHKGPFRKLATAIGLEGKMTATTEGAVFQEIARPILEHLGPYPHAALDASKGGSRKKQGTRLLKAECPECGYTVRVTQKWLDVGLPHCPEHGEMSV